MAATSGRSHPAPCPTGDGLPAGRGDRGRPELLRLSETEETLEAEETPEAEETLTSSAGTSWLYVSQQEPAALGGHDTTFLLPLPQR